ncbi:DUF2892 domain-containing protein [Rhodobacteraceae bacterium D3-12]|nr:DUF2892 domain-containing protein [Rhodobacteraceae bacterium D3-12]
MTTNMGNIDRGLRLLVAAVLAYVALATDALGAGWLFWLALLVAVVFVVTSLVGNCPLYSILGVRTCGKSK